MAFYPALPEYRPALPFTSMVSGIGAGQQTLQQGAKTALMREAVEQPKMQREALAEGAQTGDYSKLKTVAPDLWMKLQTQQQEALTKGMAEFKERAPYWTPENYPAERAQFAKAHPELANLLPPVEQMQTPQQVSGFVDLAGKAVASVEGQRATAIGEAKRKSETAFYKDVTAPEQRLQESFKMKLAGKEYDWQKNLQENRQTWATGEAKRKETLERGIHSATDKRQREQILFNNMRGEQNSLRALLAKEEQQIRRDFAGGDPVQMQDQIDKLYQTYNNMQGNIVETYKPWAKQYDITLPDVMPKLAPPKGTATTEEQQKALEILRQRGRIK